MKFLDTLFTKYDDLSNIKDTGVSFFNLNLIDIIFASKFFTNFNFFFSIRLLLTIVKVIQLTKLTRSGANEQRIFNNLAS